MEYHFVQLIRMSKPAALQWKVFRTINTNKTEQNLVHYVEVNVYSMCFQANPYALLKVFRCSLP